MKSEHTCLICDVVIAGDEGDLCESCATEVTGQIAEMTNKDEK